MNQFCVFNRPKAIKKTSCVLIGKFTMKKIRILIESSFFRSRFEIFLIFLSHLEASHFPYRGSVNNKPHLKSNEAK